MSGVFTHTRLSRLADLNVDIHDVIRLGYFIESFPEGPTMLDAVLDGIEANSALPPDYMTRFIAALPEAPERKSPANDRSPRMSSNQRRARYDDLVRQSGPFCAECGCVEHTIWRRQGVWTNGFGSYTKVHQTPNLEVDHKAPLWSGGDNNISNLWLLCIECHKKKTAAEAGQRRRA